MSEAAAPAKGAFSVELVIVILLGLASVATAYATFQASLWDSAMASEYTRSQNLTTEAQALYLEANQQYVQDAQTYAQLGMLGVDAIGEDPAIAANASAKIEALALTGIDDVLSAALDWSNSTGQYPLDSPDYLAERFGEFQAAQDEAAAHVVAGDEANAHSDQLTLYTVLLAIALFLLGIAAVVASATITWGLIGIGSVISVVAIVLTMLVPFAAVG